MYLDDTSTKLEAVLSGAASPAPHFHVAWVVHNNEGLLSKPATNRGTLSDSDTVLVAAPGTQGQVREILFVSIYNADNASVTVDVKTDNGTTELSVVKATLLTLEQLLYEKGRGWYALDANGELKTA